MDPYLRATPFFDFDNPTVSQWTERTLANVSPDPISQAKALYLAARDEVCYNPYVFSSDPDTFRASHVLTAGESYCIPKAILLGAAARQVGIPSRLGLADVKNHLSSPRLIEVLRSDIFRMHGYIELYLEGQWVKATPAFDHRLCQVMKVEPLEFDGRTDSVFQPYTADGKAHMEYIEDHGIYADLPYDFIMAGLRAAYSHLFEDEAAYRNAGGSLQHDLR
ncbi:MAG: transglutaminase family protein [Marinobacter sp.]|nr:transglutaminase family protein [Marinobacter sp.]